MTLLLSGFPREVWQPLASYLQFDDLLRLWIATPRLHAALQGSISELELDFSSTRHFAFHRYVCAFSTISKHPKSIKMRNYMFLSHPNELDWFLLPKTLLHLNFHSNDYLRGLMHVPSDISECLPVLESFSATGMHDDSDTLSWFATFPESLESFELVLSFLSASPIFCPEHLENLPIGIRSVTIKGLPVHGYRMFDLRAHQSLAQLNLEIGGVTTPHFDWSYLPSSLTDLTIESQAILQLSPPQAQWNHLFPHLTHLSTHSELLDAVNEHANPWPASLTWLEECKKPQWTRTRSHLNAQVLHLSKLDTAMVTNYVSSLSVLTTLTVYKMRTCDVSLLPQSLTSLAVTLYDDTPIDKCIFPKSILSLQLSFKTPPATQRFGDFLPRSVQSLKLSSNTSPDLEELLKNDGLDMGDDGLEQILIEATKTRARKESAVTMSAATERFDFRAMPYLYSLWLQSSHQEEILYTTRAERLPSSLRTLTVNFNDASDLFRGDMSHLSSLRTLEVEGEVGSLEVIASLPRGLTTLNCRFSRKVDWSSLHLCALPPRLKRLDIGPGPPLNTLKQEELHLLPKSLTQLGWRDKFSPPIEALPPWLWVFFSQRIYSMPIHRNLCEIATQDQEYAKSKLNVIP